MYFRHTNPVAVRSQNMISDALIDLMKRKPFQQITVTELCEEAGIGRKTFYRNFELKEDVIDFQLDALYREYEKESIQFQGELLLRHYYEFMKRHVAYLLLLQNNGLIDLLIAKFSVFVSINMPVFTDVPLEQEYHNTFIVAGMQAIFEMWARRGFTESIEWITDISLNAARWQTSGDQREP